MKRSAVWIVWMAVIVWKQTTTLAFLSLQRKLPVQTIHRSSTKRDDSATLENLATLLSEYLSSPPDDPETQKQLLITRFDQTMLFLNRTMAQPSTIQGAGMGLFVTQDCPRGTLLTCYPGDVLIDNDGNEESILWGKHTQDLANATAIRLDQNYMLRAVRDDWGIVALPRLDPNHEDTAYLGHLANDGVERLPNCESDLAPYVLQSSAMANAQHQCLQNSHMVTVATTDISKGTEVFVTYGPDYWRNQDSFVQDNEECGNDNDGDETWKDSDDYDFDFEMEEDNYDDYYEDQADSIVNEIISFDDDHQSSDTRGKGFG